MPVATDAMQSQQNKAAVRSMVIQAMKNKYPSSSAMSDLTFTWGKHRGKTFSDVLLADMDWVLWFNHLEDPTSDQLLFRFYLDKLKQETGCDAMTAASSEWEAVEQRPYAPVHPTDYEGRILRLEAEVAAMRETLDRLES